MTSLGRGAVDEGRQENCTVKCSKRRRRTFSLPAPAGLWTCGMVVPTRGANKLERASRRLNRLHVAKLRPLASKTKEKQTHDTPGSPKLEGLRFLFTRLALHAHVDGRRCVTFGGLGGAVESPELFQREFSLLRGRYDLQCTHETAGRMHEGA